MRTILPVLWLAAAVLAGCGGASRSSEYRGYAPAPEEPAGAPPPAPGPGYDGSLPVLGEAEPESTADVGKAHASAGRWVDAKKRVEPPAPPQRQSGAEKAPAPAAPVDPMVVYQGFLKLRVKRLLEAVDQITAHAERVGGYIESLTSTVVVVRVPAATFDDTMGALAGFGEVLARQIRALDVSARFTDLTGRLAVARTSRERLLALLEQTEEVQDRLAILQEIKRLSEQIETLESTLSTLRKLADFSTVTVALEPVLEQQATRVRRSPFAWVRALEAHVASLTRGKGRFELTLPAGFVEFDEDDPYRAQAADTSTLRVGVVDNEPRGDAPFWMAAVDHELVGRDEEAVADGSAGGLAWRAWRSKDLRPRYYLVGVLAVEDDVFVLEGFFPGEEAWNRHRDAFLAALNTFRVR